MTPGAPSITIISDRWKSWVGEDKPLGRGGLPAVSQSTGACKSSPCIIRRLCDFSHRGLFEAMAKTKKRLERNARQEPLTHLGAMEINLTKLSPGPEESPNISQSLWKLGRVVLRRERAHRSGKTVIIIDRFATHLPISVIEKTAKKIRMA